MAQNDFSKEVPANNFPKCLWVLVIDTSGSMNGTPIKEVNDELQALMQELEKDDEAAQKVELSVVEFNSSVTVISQPKLIEDLKIPKLSARGTTRLVDGARRGISICEDRKNWYKQTAQPYHRPFIILITDGHPDGGQDTAGLGREVTSGVAEKKFVFIPFGVEGADMNYLNSISHQDWPARKVKGYDFKAIFQWLSNSMELVANTNGSGGDPYDAIKKGLPGNSVQKTVS